MSNKSMYSVVKKIIEAKDDEEARKLLFGDDGLKINSSEYYNSLVARFVAKKEKLIFKISNEEMIFDLDNNVEEIWNIMFIGQYVLSEWEKERQNLIEQNKELRKKGDLESVEKNQKLISQIQSYIANIQKQKSLDKVKISTDSYDLDNFKNELQMLKTSILILQRFRDSFSHQNENLLIDDMVSVDNIKGKFVVKIPISYLDGFVKGKIIAKDEDSDVVTKTNEVSFPLLNACNYSPKKLESFFYNVKPNTLSLLLDYCDNDIEKLYQLPEKTFNLDENNLKELMNLIKDGLIKEQTVLKLSKARGMLGDFSEFTEILKEIKNGNIKEELILKLPENAFCFQRYYSTTRILLWSISQENITKEMFAKLPRKAFCNFKVTKKLLEAVKDKIITEETFVRLPEMIYYDFGKTTKLIEVVKDKIITEETFLKLPEIAYDNFNVTKKLIFAVGCNIITEELFQKLPEGAFNNFAVTMKLIHFVRCNIITEEVFLKLPNEAFIEFDKTMELIKTIKDKNIPIEKISFMFLYDFDMTMKLINAIDYNIITKKMIEKLSKLYFYNIDVVIKLIEVVKNKIITEEIFLNLPQGAFYNVDRTMRLINAFKDKVITEETFFKLPEMAYDRFETMLSLIHAIRSNIITEEFFRKLPEGAFNNFDVTMALIDAVKNKIITEEIFLNLDQKVFDRFRHVVYKTYGYSNFDDFINDSNSNLYKLLERVNNDFNRLEEFPEEFFTYNTKLLDELLGKYDYNLCRSIFGINDPKIISLLIYMNSVFSKLDKVNINSLSNTNIGSLISKMNGVSVSEDNIISVLNNIRNACCHFRFEVLKDDNKICLYDINSSGEKHFQIILNITDILELTKFIEDYLLLDNKEIEVIEEENFSERQQTIDEMKVYKDMLVELSSNQSHKKK